MNAMIHRLAHLVASEEGTSIAEFSLFVGFLVLTGAGFFCFTAGQFRDVFQSSYDMK